VDRQAGGRVRPGSQRQIPRALHGPAVRRLTTHSRSYPPPSPYATHGRSPGPSRIAREEVMGSTGWEKLSLRIGPLNGSDAPVNQLARTIARSVVRWDLAGSGTGSDGVSTLIGPGTAPRRSGGRSTSSVVRGCSKPGVDVAHDGTDGLQNPGGPLGVSSRRSVAVARASETAGLRSCRPSHPTCSRRASPESSNPSHGPSKRSLRRPRGPARVKGRARWSRVIPESVRLP
jgi:hypothetical protein